jgi:hypothetical protein
VGSPTLDELQRATGLTEEENNEAKHTNKDELKTPQQLKNSSKSI